MQETLQHYLQLWELEKPELIAETFSSHVYRVEGKGEVLALKVLTEDGAYDEGGGALALEYFGGYGAVRILHYDKGAHLLEYVAGEDLLPMVEAGQDDEATRISAEVLNKLHRNNGKAPKLRTLKRWFKSLYKKAKADEKAGIESIYRRGIIVADKLLAEPIQKQFSTRIFTMRTFDIMRNGVGWPLTQKAFTANGRMMPPICSITPAKKLLRMKRGCFGRRESSAKPLISITNVISAMPSLMAV
jgi:hypothetical protein